jgi:hypothetical protein
MPASQLLSMTTQMRATTPLCMATPHIEASCQVLIRRIIQEPPDSSQRDPGGTAIVRAQSASLDAMALEQGGLPLNPPVQVSRSIAAVPWLKHVDHVTKGPVRAWWTLRPCGLQALCCTPL